LLCQGASEPARRTHSMIGEFFPPARVRLPTNVI
jgi:hypothetical protein